MTKTLEELKEEIRVNQILKEERKLSDESYAIKLAQHAIFALITFICLAVIGYILKSVVK